MSDVDHYIDEIREKALHAKKYCEDCDKFRSSGQKCLLFGGQCEKCLVNERCINDKQEFFREPIFGLCTKYDTFHQSCDYCEEEH